MPPPPKKKSSKSSSPNIPLLESSPSSKSSSGSSVQLLSPRRKKSKKKRVDVTAAATTTTQSTRVPSNARDDRIFHGPAFESSSAVGSSTSKAGLAKTKAKKKKKAPPPPAVSTTSGTSTSENSLTVDMSRDTSSASDDDDVEIIVAEKDNNHNNSSSEDGSDDEDDGNGNLLQKRSSTLTEKQQLEAERIERAVFAKVRKLLQTRPSRDGVTEDLPYWRKNILEPLMNSKQVLLEKTQVVDDALSKGGELVQFLELAIPDKVLAKANKPDIVDICLEAWRVIDLVLFQSARKAQLGKRQSHALNDYIGMMERAFNYCRAVVAEEENAANSLQSETMPPGEDNRGYCMDGAVQPEKSEHRICPKCSDHFMHEPPSNVQVRERNKTLKEEWKTKNAAFDKYQKSLGTRNPLPAPLDDKGKPMKKRLIPLKFEDELLVCKAYMRTHNYSYTGFQCPNCKDRTCSTCKNKCRFVCSKNNHTSLTTQFALQAKANNQRKQTGAEQAHGFLSGLSKLFTTSSNTHRDRMLEEQKSGLITSTTAPEQIDKYARECAMVDTCNAMLFNPPAYEAAEYFNDQMIAAADQRGETFTKEHGDMRCYKGATAAKSRASNTGINHGKLLHLYDTPSQQSNNPGRIVVTGTTSTGSCASRQKNVTDEICQMRAPNPPNMARPRSTLALASSSVAVSGGAGAATAGATTASASSSAAAAGGAADASTKHTMFEYSEEDPTNITPQLSLTPPDVVELREAVEEEKMFGTDNDSTRRKKLNQLSTNLHMKELPKQTKTGLAILEKRNITSQSEKINLLLNQIQLED